MEKYFPVDIQNLPFFRRDVERLEAITRTLSNSIAPSSCHDKGLSVVRLEYTLFGHIPSLSLRNMAVRTSEGRNPDEKD
jgi:hypothetical protein